MRAALALAALAAGSSACTLLLSEDYTSGAPSDGDASAEDAWTAIVGDDAGSAVSSDAGVADAPADAEAVRARGRAFLAVGKWGRRAVSTDEGLTWTVVAEGDADAGGFQGAAFGLERFVAVGTVYTPVFRSAATLDLDSFAWTETEMANLGGRQHIAFGADRFVAVGGQSSAVSVNGVDWLTYGVDVLFHGITFGAGQFVAVGERGGEAAVARSKDGQSWTVTKIGGAVFTVIAYGDGRFVAAGHDGRTGTSLDGISWTSSPDKSTQVFHSLTYGDGLFVTNDGRASADGLTWTVPVFGDGPVVHGGGVFLHFDYPEKRFYRSTNGTAWSATDAALPWVEGLAYGAW